MNEVVDQIMKAVQKEYKELKTLNVMLLGKTGVGKSTLINNMFNEPLAKTGIGKPVTDRIRKITKERFPLAIYDTPGLELVGENSVKNLMDQVIAEIKKGLQSGNISDAIHCIWYCVGTPSRRFETAEVEFLRKFLDQTAVFHVPVILVLTQSFDHEAAEILREAIEKEVPGVEAIIPVLAEDYPLNNEYLIKAYGLDTLASVTAEVIPEAVQKTFVSLQNANTELKQKNAAKVVKAAAKAAGAAVFAPVPFADALLIVPGQIGMLAAITAIFGIPVEKATMVTIIASALGTTGATSLGRLITGNMAKFLPGAGGFLGGAYSSATAWALTTALGYTYIVILSKIAEGELSISDISTKRGRDLITRTFRKELSFHRKAEKKKKTHWFGRKDTKNE